MAKSKAVTARLKALAKTNGPFFVLASQDLEYKKDVQLASCMCSDCGTHFVAEANTAPFCVTCGSEEVEIEEVEIENEMPEDDSEMSAVMCASCGTHNIVHDDIALAMTGEMHCVTCGTEIQYSTDSILASEENDDEEMDDEDLDEETAAEESDFEAEEENVDDEIDEEILASKELDEEECEEECEDEEKASSSKQTAADAEEEEEMEEDEEEDSETASVKLIETASGELDLIRVGTKITAYVGITPVATLSKEKAGEYASIMASDTFTSAVKHTATQIGMQKALAHYGFELISVDVPVPRLVEEKASEKFAEKEAELSAAIKDLREDYRQSLQIASAGLNKSFFKGQINVLKRALFDELAALNIRSPEKIIDKVFAAHSDSYHSTLLEIAEDMMGKNPEVRNQIAEAVGAANYQSVESDEDEESSDDSIEARLETAGIRKPTRNKIVSPVTASVHEVRRINGGRLFK